MDYHKCSSPSPIPRTFLWGSVFAFSLLFFFEDPLWGRKEKENNIIQVWERQPGNHSAGIAMAKKNRKMIPIRARQMQTQTLYDIQYEATGVYQGIFLKDLLKQYRKPPSANLVILHFANAMIVPWLLKPDPQLAPKVFIAFSMKTDKRMQAQFPSLSHKTDVTMDPRPIEFSGNKLVVSSRRHPWLREPSGELFTPFLHVDSLIGIEWVNEDAYYDQFKGGYDPDVPSESTKIQLNQAEQDAALEIFKHNCQYCHGFRNVGASFGWDFIVPIPIQEHKKAEELLGHVSHRSYNALERGLMMPTFGDFSLEEMKLFLRYSKTVSDAELLWPYAPAQ
jgi:hypothetical protein